MRFGSDSQRRAAFANMSMGGISGLNTVKFARKPSKKMVGDIAKGLEEPITDFDQLVPNPGAVRVERGKKDVTGLANVRERRKDIVSEVKSFPDHGAGFFPVENYGGSAGAAKADAERIKDMISSDGVVIAWVDPIWDGSILVGYTVRAKDVETGEEVLDKDMKVMEDYEDV